MASCEKTYTGGFSKTPEAPPDILHSFYSLCYRSLAKRHGLRPMHVPLGIADFRFAAGPSVSGALERG